MLLDTPLLLPTPFTVLKTLYLLVLTPTFWVAIATSLSRIFIGLIGGMFFGTTLAFISTKNRFFLALFDPVLTVCKAVPVASFILLLLVWFPAKTLPTIVCFMMVLPAFYTTMRTAFQSLDKGLVEMSNLFQLPTPIFLRHIVLPQVAPFFIAASTLCIGLAFKSSIACEIIALANNAIGSHLYDAKIFLDTPTVFAWTIVIILLSLALEKSAARLLTRKLTTFCEVHYD